MVLYCMASSIDVLDTSVPNVAKALPLMEGHDTTPFGLGGEHPPRAKEGNSIQGWFNINKME